MSKGLERLTEKTTTNDYYIPVKKGMLMAGYVDKLGEYEDIDTNPTHLANIKKAFDIIKKHILNRDMDTSGIYLEFHNGRYEPYYTIEIRNGVKQIVPQEEYDLLKKVLL